MTTEQNPNLHIPNVRLSYFFGHQPYTGDDPLKPNFGTHLLMQPDHPSIPAIKAAQRAVAVAMWGDEADAVMAQLQAKDRLVLHNGTISKPGNEAYKGMIYVSANSGKKRFTIVDADRTPLAESSGRPYSGCWANAIIQVWAQQNKFGRGINAQICGVQFVKHGDAFGGGRVAAADEFSVVAASTDAPPPSAGQAAGLF
jgi:hypothetical protein